MELNNYYRITFENNKEFIIGSKLDKTQNVFTDLTKTKFVTLQLKEGDPLLMNSERVFSVQRVGDKENPGVVGVNTKIWRQVK